MRHLLFYSFGYRQFISQPLSHITDKKQRISLRNIALSDACVSIFALQRSMLVSFGYMSERDICIFNAVIGAVICVIVFLLGLNLVKSKKLIFKNLNK